MSPITKYQFSVPSVPSLNEGTSSANSKGARLKKPKKNHSWSTTSEGAFVGIKTLANIDNSFRIKALKLTESGAKLLGISTVSNKIILGRICVKLKDLLGENGFRELAERFWCANGDHYESIERELQYCQKMYKFSKRRGVRLNTNIPIDSYRKIMAYVTQLSTKKGQSNCIRKINRTGEFEGIAVKRTKRLREAIEEAKRRQGKSKQPDPSTKNQDVQKNPFSPEIALMNDYYLKLKEVVNLLVSNITSKSEKKEFSLLQQEFLNIMDQLIKKIERRNWIVKYNENVKFDPPLDSDLYF